MGIEGLRTATAAAAASFDFRFSFFESVGETDSAGIPFDSMAGGGKSLRFATQRRKNFVAMIASELNQTDQVFPGLESSV